MDEAAIRAQLEAHHAASFGWAVSCCRCDAVLAEDVLQIAYLKVLQGRAKFFGQSAFKTWWFAVIRQTALDELRRLWFRRLKVTAFGESQTTTVHEESYGESLDQADRQALFRRALAKLPGRQREVLHLVFYQEQTIEQAAVIMKVSLGAARTHYHRGKQNLRKLLAKEAEAKNESAQRQSYREVIL
jgi:RNA polymerase sigma-70 factor (ECF subfamily)